MPHGRSLWAVPTCCPPWSRVCLASGFTLTSPVSSQGYPTYARHAGFGVVLDTLPDLPEHAKDLCLARVKYDPTVVPFAPVATGLIPDEQNINRAELRALIRAAELAGPYSSLEVEFCSDSAFAITEVGAIIAGGVGLYPDLTPLLREVWRDTFSLRKVKAHADMALLHGSELWDSAGNEVADQVAKSAVAGDFGALRTTMSDIAQFCQDQADELFIFARFLLDMSYEESRLKQLQSSGVPTMVQSVDQVMMDTQVANILALQPPLTLLMIGHLRVLGHLGTLTRFGRGLTGSSGQSMPLTEALRRGVRIWNSWWILLGLRACVRNWLSMMLVVGIFRLIQGPSRDP